MFTSLRARIEQKIGAATLERSPFPHLIVEDFFPEDVFAKILEFNPFKTNKGTEWLDKSASKDVKSKTPYYTRKQINFHANQPFDAPPEQRAFWDEMKDVFLQDRWFERTVAAKYPEYFRIRFG